MSRGGATFNFIVFVNTKSFPCFITLEWRSRLFAEVVCESLIASFYPPRLHHHLLVLTVASTRRRGRARSFSRNVVVGMLTPGQALHHPAARYIGALTLVVLVLHLLFASFGSHGSGGSSSYSANSLRRQTWFLGERKGAEWEPGVKDYALADTQGRARGRARGNETATVTASAPIRRENATFVSLARNSDLWELLGSIREVEG